ncbi:MAG: ATP-binding cassette domain-containing protein [Azospirillum sp.]|nr:ATP-binding cassette domain-containing protein [Azospirillum sp.]
MSEASEGSALGPEHRGPPPLDGVLDEPLVTLSAVSKTYATGIQALDRVDLAIGDHEFISLIGPSGCGKSTLLRLIAGLGAPSAGSIRRPEGESRRDIGFVFQEPTLMPWATVAANVGLPLKLAGVAPGAIRPRVEEGLARVGLAGFARAFPRELSGGMKMRVSIARALITRPRVLLMDEPFSAIDEPTRFQLFDDLLGLWSKARWTVVFVTHSLFDSVYLSNRVVVMTPRPGRIYGDLAIDQPYPRDALFRTSPEFGDWARRVAALMTSAAEPAAS